MRIHFTRADLARTFLADGPDPMWELVNSLQLLQSRYGQAVFNGWRRQVAERLRGQGLGAQVRGRLLPVAPHASYFPDLLTPPDARLGVEGAIDTILHTPRSRLGQEIGRLGPSPAAAASWLADLAAGRAGAVNALGDLLHTYHRLAVEPYWARLRHWVDSDLAARHQVIRDRGVDGLLDSFRPMMRWRNPVLELVGHPSDRQVHLGGRGILLVPSYFCWLHPLTIFDSTLPQVVVYPVEHATHWLDRGTLRADRDALNRLLGHTRAHVLLATRGGRSTSDLAQRLGVSEATISHHTRILREAGLITSRRRANTMLHILEPLGAALLRQRL